MVSSVDPFFLRGLTTRTDGLSVDFFPPLRCKACATEFVNRKGLRSHKCVGKGGTQKGKKKAGKLKKKKKKQATQVLEREGRRMERRRQGR